jgi:hypothetical protein
LLGTSRHPRRRKFFLADNTGYRLKARGKGAPKKKKGPPAPTGKFFAASASINATANTWFQRRRERGRPVEEAKDMYNTCDILREHEQIYPIYPGTRHWRLRL